MYDKIDYKSGVFSLHVYLVFAEVELNVIFQRVRKLIKGWDF